MSHRDATPQLIKLSDYTPPAFLIDTTALHIELTEEGTTVVGTLSLRRNGENNLKPSALVLDAEKMDVLEVSIDGSVIDISAYSHADNQLRIETVNDQFQLVTKVRIHPETNTSLMGLYKSRTMFCTQCEAEGFRKITPYLDRPDVMSEFEVTLVADKEKYPVLLSNGNLMADRVLEDGRREVVWQDPHKKPAYLFALVAGDLAHIEDSFTTASGRDVVIRIYVEPKDLDKCDHAIRSLKASMTWDEEKYGREYDLDIFMIVAVDDFNMGAMENKGLNIFNTSAVLANPKTTTDARFQWVEAVVAHEYFHNWSGNRVTCRDWFQLSLKEGFTVFRDSEFSADLNSRTVKRIEDVRVLQAYQFAEDAGPLAHPVQPDSYMEINNFYTVTVYDKGAEVVRMQANLLGPVLFRKATDLYFERHDGQAVTIEDFVACMEEVSGQDLTQFKRWYKQGGTPVLNVVSDYNEERGELSVEFSQSCPPTPESDKKLPFLIPVRMGLVGEEGDLPLHANAAELTGETEAVLQITQASERITFTGLKERPALSLLRGFSAPVKLIVDDSKEDLVRRMHRDSDGLNRWDACQRLLVSAVEESESAALSQQSWVLDQGLVDACEALLASTREEAGVDLAMVAQMLSLPSMLALAEMRGSIQIDALYSARKAVYQQLAERLHRSFKAGYLANMNTAPYEPSATQIAQRSFKNMCMHYWLSTDDSAAVAAVIEQFETAENMTDQSSALSAMVNASGEEAQREAARLIAAFYEQWSHEALVVNQWLSVQASSRAKGNLARVRSLMEHAAFDGKNPNKVRSLIGGFCQLDPNNFHHSDGSGYAFLGDQVLRLNTTNPQIASRLLQPLTKWQLQDKQRSEMMRAQLERIAGEKGLSSDVNELVTKSLTS